MTATTQKRQNVSPERTAAIRHAVLRDLLFLLPPANVAQTDQFIANLALQRTAYTASTIRQRDRLLFDLKHEFLFLRATPDIATYCGQNIVSKAEIELALSEKFGERLWDVPGLYKNDSGRWKLNLPEACLLHGYQSRTGYFNGILCQPIDYANSFFLLSSAKFGGSKAVRMEPREQARFDEFKEPAMSPIPTAGSRADLSGLKWTGRRFIEI